MYLVYPKLKPFAIYSQKAVDLSQTDSELKIPSLQIISLSTAGEHRASLNSATTNGPSAFLHWAFGSWLLFLEPLLNVQPNCAASTHVFQLVGR